MIHMHVYRFNAMALPEEIASMKSENVADAVKNEIQTDINNLIKQFFCAQFSKCSTKEVPRQLEKADHYLWISSIEGRVKELRKINEKDKIIPF